MRLSPQDLNIIFLTIKIRKQRAFFLRFCELVFDFYVTSLIEHNMIGGQIARLDFIGLKFSTAINNRIKQVPNLKL